ncbi:MAG: dTDP-4-dehydrorhamnose reductase [Rhodoferax sp.]|nr:dTDP-4-dehydrorhamnose reductase [Rhodoferax sp.]MCF8208650.1 dTDP-4-dehydrorhamnose reductase [Rhodoferax sp.]
MKILLLGCNGQVGWELQRSLAPLGEVIALSRDSARNPDGLCGDLTQLDALARTVRSVKPDVLVNAAAHTAVDKAEAEPELAHTLNALAPGVLATEAKALGAWLVHYSTDYVFDGSGSTPWKEDDATGPLSVYGHSKLAGEQAVASQCARHLIFRTSWVYAARGGNFAKTMLRLAAQRETLQVINDQHGAPTGADLLADVTAHAIRQVGVARASADPAPMAGIYHLVAGGETTWFEYANFVIDNAKSAQPATTWAVQSVQAVPSSAFMTAAKRPLNSRLDTSKLRSTFDLQLPDWKLGVARMLNEIAP